MARRTGEPSARFAVETRSTLTGARLRRPEIQPPFASVKTNPVRTPFSFSISLLLVAGLVIGALFSSGCATVPETGRSQLMIVSEGEEAKMGLSAFDDIKKKEKISTDAAANTRVRRVGERIAKAVGRAIPNAEWEYVVFDSDQINAFALPGGKVGVYTGLLKLVKSDSELACVMGHEVAHVTARHGAERASEGMAAAGGAAIAGIASNDSKYSQEIQLAYGLLAGGVILKFSRTHESEADHIGLMYAARAGYDPRAAVDFWKKMSASKKGQGGTPELLSTHPSDETRIKDIESLLPKVMPIYEAAEKAP